MNLDRVRQFAFSLPEVTEAPHFQYSSLRVGGKIFVTMPPDGAHIHVFVGEPARETALALDPANAEKLLWGGKVVGLRVMLAKAKPAFVEGLIRQAWTAKAPKKLIRQIEQARR